MKNTIIESLFDKDLPVFETHIKSLFASIPYNNFTGIKLYEYEGYYVSVFYAYIKSFSITVIAEDVTNKGRIDLTINIPDIAIYVIEFKTDESSALEQVKNKCYHEKYMGEGLPVFLLGIEFNTDDRNVSRVEYEEVKT